MSYWRHGTETTHNGHRISLEIMGAQKLNMAWLFSVNRQLKFHTITLPWQQCLLWVKIAISDSAYLYDPNWASSKPVHSGPSCESLSLAGFFNKHEATRNISYSSLDGMLVHCIATPRIKFTNTHLNTWVERGTVQVKCLAQEHNAMS